MTMATNKKINEAIRTLRELNRARASIDRHLERIQRRLQHVDFGIDDLTIQLARALTDDPTDNDQFTGIYRRIIEGASDENND